DQLPAAVRQLHALNRGPGAGRCDEDDLLVASHAVEPCALDVERILVSARCGSRLSPHRGGTIKPAGTPILEQNPMEAERRCRTQARPDLGVIIPGNQQCWSSGFRPPRTPLGSRASKYIPSNNCGPRRAINRRTR